MDVERGHEYRGLDLPGDRRRRRDHGDRDLQRTRSRPEPVPERVRADRRPAQTPLRLDPESRRDREGLHGARASDARSGDRGAPDRRARRRAGRSAAGTAGSDARPRDRGSRAGWRAGTSARRRRGVSRAQGQSEFARAPGRARERRESRGVRTPGLQRLGDGVQHEARELPGERLRFRVPLRRRRAAAGERIRRRAQGAPGVVQLSPGIAAGSTPPISFFEHQAEARRQSGRLVVLFILAVAGVTIAVNLAVGIFWLTVIGPSIVPYSMIGAGHLLLAIARGPWAVYVWTTLVTLAVIASRSLVAIHGLRAGGDAVARLAGGVPIDRDGPYPAERRSLH